MDLDTKYAAVIIKEHTAQTIAPFVEKLAALDVKVDGIKAVSQSELIDHINRKAKHEAGLVSHELSELKGLVMKLSRRMVDLESESRQQKKIIAELQKASK